MSQLLVRALNRNNEERPPVWFMRQAGRYHSHYQNLRRQHGFVDLCKTPELATEVTLGPIAAFDFDAAILFSDILFPLECLNFSLGFEPGPVLSWLLDRPSALGNLRPVKSVETVLDFQRQAIQGIRQALPQEKSLIGFVGSPLTLFYFAALGSHKVDLEGARVGLRDGRFENFSALILDVVLGSMILQAQGGANALAIFDTCAGDLTPEIFQDLVVPVLNQLLGRFKVVYPEIPLIYYSKGTGPEHWRALSDLPISCLGIDWQHPLPQVFEEFGERWSIQGNVDPSWLLKDWPQLEPLLTDFFSQMRQLPQGFRRGWVCGLGHGILPTTPETNVKNFIDLQKRIFAA